MTETPHPSISALHKQWVKLENEQHELAMAIERQRRFRCSFLEAVSCSNSSGRRAKFKC
jgi:hypothetical protein